MIMTNVIAIDGPSGSGKSTVAKIIAKELNFQYIDTGSMYRAITYKMLQNNIPVEDKEGMRDILSHTEFDFIESKLYMDGLEIKDEIRGANIDSNVSSYASKPIIREYLANKQIEIGNRRPSVIDGRDIGSVLFPNAILKIFLTADTKARAIRRYEQNLLKGFKDLSLDQIEEEIKRRDYEDTNRTISPLKKAVDAIEIDSSNMSIEETVEKIYQLYKEKVK